MAEIIHLVLIEKRGKGKMAEIAREKLSLIVENYPSKILAEVTTISEVALQLTKT